VREQVVHAEFDARVALIADTHLGVYKNERYLARIVKLVNQAAPDMVLIAGDHTYEPLNEAQLDRLFVPYAQLDAPIYAVLGNHDVERPGPDIRDRLVPALEQSSIIYMNNDLVEFPEFTLA
jgi:hypothetical protein